MLLIYIALLRFDVLRGYVYFLSNPKMPGLIKVGSTSREVEERVQELSGATGVPVPLRIEAYFLSRAPERDESEIHMRLEAMRIKGREFFEAELAQAIAIAEAVIGAKPVFLRNPLATCEDRGRETLAAATNAPLRSMVR